MALRRGETTFSPLSFFLSFFPTSEEFWLVLALKYDDIIMTIAVYKEDFPVEINILGICRNQQNLMEPRSPIRGGANINEAKTPMTANSRTHRRQSLTGIPGSGSDKSRRSSIGGKPIDSSK